jgi:hypothetical protein
MIRALALLLLLAMGCGGSSVPVARSPDEASSPAPIADPQAGDTAPATDAPGAPIDDAECARLADHLIDLSFADKRGKGAEAYTAEDAEAAKRELRQSMKPACAQLPRRDFTCAMAAKSSADLTACQPAPR